MNGTIAALVLALMPANARAEPPARLGPPVRIELAPHIGTLTYDAVRTGYLIGTGLGVHVSEILALEAFGTFSPDMSGLDWKPQTMNGMQMQEVDPLLDPVFARLVGTTGLSAQLSPIFGEVALGTSVTRFDVFADMGSALVNTQDDLVALGQDPPEPRAEQTANQWHPGLRVGGGLRVAATPALAFRVQAHALSYIEVYESTSLEVRTLTTVTVGASLFLPRRGPAASPRPEAGRVTVGDQARHHHRGALSPRTGRITTAEPRHHRPRPLSPPPVTSALRGGPPTTGPAITPVTPPLSPMARASGERPVTTRHQRVVTRLA